MSNHDPQLTLTQIRQYTEEAIQIASGKQRSDIDNNRNRVLELALVRLVEMIGEAANRLPEETKDQYPDIPWRNIIATRNRLIHGYDTINKDILWAIVSDDLPHILKQLNP